MQTIRPAHLGDLDEIWAIVGRAVAHMNAQGNPQWGIDYPTLDHYAADVARGELYVAQGEDSTILGVVCLNDDQSAEYAPLPWRIPGPAIAIHRMAVDPAAQGQGVARGLFLFAEKLAKDKGFSTIHADTYSLNNRMQSLFLSMGYDRVASVHFERDGRHLPYPCFEKVLFP